MLLVSFLGSLVVTEAVQIQSMENFVKNIFINLMSRRFLEGPRRLPRKSGRIHIYIYIYICERAASKGRRFLHFGGSGPHPFYLVLHQRSPLPFAEVSIQGTPYLWIRTPRVPRLPLDLDTKGPPLPPLDPDSKSSLPTPCPLTSLEFR
jgi:hypothetical protein